VHKIHSFIMNSDWEETRGANASTRQKESNRQLRCELDSSAVKEELITSCCSDGDKYRVFHDFRT
jgi:hypothetical protein